MIFPIFLFVLFCLLNQSIIFCSFEDFTEEQKKQITNSVMLGAMGDVLGAPIEFNQNIENILKVEGYDKDFLENRFKSVVLAIQKYYNNQHRKNFNYIPYTDDTRMSLLVLQVLWGVYKNKDTYSSDENMQNDVIIQIAHAFKRDSKDEKFGWVAGYREPGKSTVSNVDRLQDSNSIENALLPKLTFENPENDQLGGGCGSVMRAAPFGYFKDFWEMAGIHSMITHNHPIAIASCVSLAQGIHMMIHEGKTNQNEIITEMINVADKEERNAVSYEDCKNNRYTLRMEKVLEAAVEAAKEMKKIRSKKRNNSSFYDFMDPYLIPFHWLMQESNNFKNTHMKMFVFEQWREGDYSYDKPLFSGKDAATCLAIAMYNFYLYIPEDINDEMQYGEVDRKCCVINAITSAMIISGDSDSAAAVTGQLIGAYIKTPWIFENLTKIIEDSKKMMKLIRGEEVDLFDHTEKKVTDVTWWSNNKKYVYSGLGILSLSIAFWFLWTKLLHPKYSAKKS